MRQRNTTTRLLLFCHAEGEIALIINTFTLAPVILALE
jgi:hypothetical protein